MGFGLWLLIHQQGVVAPESDQLVVGEVFGDMLQSETDPDTTAGQATA